MNITPQARASVASGLPPFAALPFHLMAKPVGPHCNLDCAYCFYTEKEALFSDRPPRMSEVVLEAYIRGVAEMTPGPELQYAWQGGEPTLAGLDFFRRAVALQKQVAGGRRVSNAFQTNGMLVDDAWCEFFANEGFLVGLSLDGPRELHDAYRRDRGGQGSHAQVMRALDAFRRHGVAFNTLTSVHDRNVRQPLEVYRFLRDAGVEHMQFIPLVERKPTVETEALGLTLGTPPEAGSAPGRQAVTPWSVAPEAFGDFLVAIFDEWARHDIGRVFVQTFEVTLASWMGMGAGLCHFAEICGRALVVESNGDVYACDHYVYPEYRRGNLVTESLRDGINGREQERFGLSKRDALPAKCRACEFLFACRGGCLKHRFRLDSATREPVNYLCAGYTRFFRHVDPPLRILADLLRQGRPATDLMALLRTRDTQSALAGAGRNDPCPCGSGKKFKACCGKASPVS